MQGRIATLVQERGFGFIEADGKEFFFHRGAVEGDFGDFAEGSRVEFQVNNDAKGDEPNERPRAINVRLADDEMPAVENVPLPAEKVGR